MLNIDPSEPLSRFILNKNDYRSDGTVRHRLFLPSPKTAQTSVFRIVGLSENAIWEIGDNEVAQKRKPPLSLIGRADISTQQVLKTGLHIDVDDIPPRHANIIDWPIEPSAQRLIAMELAENAQLHLKNEKN